MTIELLIDGTVYGHDVSLTYSASGIWKASASVHDRFRGHFWGQGMDGRASAAASTFQGCMRLLQDELEKTYFLAGLDAQKEYRRMPK